MYHASEADCIIDFSIIYPSETFFANLLILKNVKSVVVLLNFSASVGEENEITENCIGEYSGVTRTLYLERCGKLVWLEERPPRDRTITR